MVAAQFFMSKNKKSKKNQKKKKKINKAEMKSQVKNPPKKLSVSGAGIEPTTLGL
jgi:hypothetical protein